MLFCFNSPFRQQCGGDPLVSLEKTEYHNEWEKMMSIWHEIQAIAHWTLQAFFTECEARLNGIEFRSSYSFELLNDLI